jgi:hypothetical protein
MRLARIVRIPDGINGNLETPDAHAKTPAIAGFFGFIDNAFI